MARTLIDPIVPETPPTIIQQGIDNMRFIVPHVWDEVDGLMKFDRQSIKLVYDVTTYDENGEFVEHKTREVPFLEWPAVYKTAVKEVYDLTAVDASNAGLLEPGDDEDIGADTP